MPDITGDLTKTLGTASLVSTSTVKTKGTESKTLGALTTKGRSFWTTTPANTASKKLSMTGCG